MHETTSQIWEEPMESYSNVESQVHNLIQGDMILTDSQGQLIRLWQLLDLYETMEWTVQMMVSNTKTFRRRKGL